jgi:hypothetical protein
MARMIPERWEDRNGSLAERLIYRKLRDETPSDWVAVHSVGVASHSTKPWAELDFVVIGPFGVLCLEVKGGRITTENGRWSTNDARLKESPFSQAGGGAAALHRELEPRIPALRRAVVGYGVMFPDVRFEAAGPGIDRHVLYDDRDLLEPIQRWLERVADHWLDFHGRTGDRFRPLSRAERTEITRLLAPSFDFVPTLAARVAAAESDLVELTRRQAKVLRGLRHQDRAFIRGGAGTGKTLLAVEEAERFAAAGARVLLCCRSPHLAAYIRSGLDTELIDTRGYEELLRSFVTAGDRWPAVPDASDEDLLSVFLPEHACEAIIDLDRAGEYDVVVVDEAQDLLLEGALDVLDLLLADGLEGGRWRVFLDHKQNVFSAVDREQLDRITRHTTSQYQLFENCRNTPEVNTTTSILSAVDPDETVAQSGPDVEMRFVLDRNEDVIGAAAVVRSWLQRSILAEDITVVAVDEQVAERVRRDWPEGAAGLVTLGEGRRGAMCLTTAADFKGLEAMAVVVVGARELHERETLRRMYVACSRARVLLGVVLDESARDDFNTRSVEFARRQSEKST